jgi:hypothetical protein
MFSRKESYRSRSGDELFYESGTLGVRELRLVIPFAPEFFRVEARAMLSSASELFGACARVVCISSGSAPRLLHVLRVVFLRTLRQVRGIAARRVVTRVSEDCTTRGFIAPPEAHVI